MTVLRIACHNVKLFFKNIIIIPVLIGMPVFQIHLLSSVMGKVAENIEVGTFVEVVLLRPSSTVQPAQFFAASMLVMFILITGMIATASLIEERENKTLARMLASPLSKAEIIIGNLIGQIFISLFFATAIMAISQFFLGISWGTAWVNLVVVTLLVVYVAISLGLVFAGLFKDSKTAGGVMSFLIIVMSFLSDGLTGGSITGNGTFGLTSNLTINKWAYQAYVSVMAGQQLTEVATNLIVLASIGTVFAVIAIILFRRETIHE